MKLRLRLLLQEITLDADEITIGRSSECAVTIDDALLSRKHAAIRRTGASFELVDLESRNGTRLNGERITAPALLRSSDRIRVGGTELVVILEADVQDDPDSRRRLRTGRFEICARCGASRPAEAIACARCGAVTASS